MEQRRATHHHGNLRAELVDRALARVRADGAGGFSLRDVSAAAGVTPAAAYRHFASRGDLLDEVVVEGFALMARRMLASVARSSADGALLATGEAYVEFAVAEPHLFGLMFGSDGAGGRARALGTPSDVPSASEQVRRALAERGRADDAAFLQVWGLAHGLASLAVAGIGTDREARQALADFVGLLDP